MKKDTKVAIEKKLVTAGKNKTEPQRTQICKCLCHSLSSPAAESICAASERRR
jgi:hypothetical protein